MIYFNLDSISDLSKDLKAVYEFLSEVYPTSFFRIASIKVDVVTTNLIINVFNDSDMLSKTNTVEVDIKNVESD